MLAIRTFATFAPAMRVQAVLSVLRHCLRIMLPALAVALFVLGSGTSLAQTAVPTSPDIQPTPAYFPPPDPVDPPYDDAAAVSISAPATMVAGSTASVTVTMQNTGTTTWYPRLTTNPYRLGSQNPTDNLTWGIGRIELASTVAPGGQAVFGFTITAPSAAGTYSFSWAMLRESLAWFGGTASSTITVSAPTPKPTISASHTSMVAGQSFTMSWSTTNATSLTHVCTASGTGYTVNESLAVSGSRSMTAQSGWVGYPSTCTWTASGAGGSASYTETLTTVAATNSSVTYIHTDGLGSPVARTDASGTVISRTRYEPYGYVASGVQPTIGFTGHVNDVDTGLTYMQQRYYDPVAGRFLSIDPVVTDANTGGSFNRYVYASNSPYKYIDPDGRQERAAEALSDQYRRDFASGNVRDYDPFVVPAAVVTGAMLVAPPIAAAVVAGAPAEGALAGSAALAVPKADFIVTPKGVTVPNGPAQVRDSLTNAGMPGKAVQNPSGTETGTVHNVPGMKMDVRVMDGGPVHPPRVVASRQGTSQPVDPASGKNFGNIPKAEQRDASHIKFQEN